MNTRFVILALGSMLCTSGYADIIYDFDFEEPDFTADTQITSGSGYIADGDVYVRTGIADFSTQVASLEPAGSLGFGSAPVQTSGVVLISWDMAVVSLGSASGTDYSAAFLLSLSEGASIVGTYQYDSTFEINGQNVASYTLGAQSQYSVRIDLDFNAYDFLIDGITIIDDEPIAMSAYPQSVVFTREFLTSPEYGIDNFRWEVIPEPASLLLLMLGGAGLYVTRSTRQPRRQ